MDLQKSLLTVKRSLGIKIEFQAALQPGTVTTQPPGCDGRTLIPSFNIFPNTRLMQSEFDRLGVFNGCLIFNADRHHMREFSWLFRPRPLRSKPKCLMLPFPWEQVQTRRSRINLRPFLNMHNKHSLCCNRVTSAGNVIK